MASKQSTVGYIAEQIAQAGIIRYRKMFGEYAIYCNEKVVAFVCDDQLYLKPTAAGKKLIKNLEEAPPYPGAKMYYLISPDLWEDRNSCRNLSHKLQQNYHYQKSRRKFVNLCRPNRRFLDQKVCFPNELPLSIEQFLMDHR